MTNCRAVWDMCLSCTLEHFLILCPLLIYPSRLLSKDTNFKKLTHGRNPLRWFGFFFFLLHLHKLPLPGDEEKQKSWTNDKHHGCERLTCYGPAGMEERGQLLWSLALVQQQQSRVVLKWLKRANSPVLAQRLGEARLPHWQGDKLHSSATSEGTELFDVLFWKNYWGLLCMQKEFSSFFFFFHPPCLWVLDNWNDGYWRYCI